MQLLKCLVTSTLKSESGITDLKIVDPLKETKQSLQASTAIDHTSPDHWHNAVYGDPIKDDFRVFLTVLWHHLGLGDPTPLQLDVAYYLQHHEWNDEIDRLIIKAFRGMAKSWITAAFALWNLLRNPQLKIGVFSGSAKRAVNFVNFCLNLVAEMPLLQHLRPKPNQRQSSSSFDVGPSRPDQTPSVFAAGITASIVGFRADIIVGDDVETNTNSQTPDMREKISNGVKEFDAIIKPHGQIIFLGTPQTEASIYVALSKRGYDIKIWPALFPNRKQRRSYGDRLARYISYKIEQDPTLVGHSTEPTRFSDEDLAGRRLSWGAAGFALQYMLDTSLADVDRYPLRLRNLIVMSLDQRMGPDAVAWGTGSHLKISDVEPYCLDGDGLYGPSSVSETFSKWNVMRAFIDPSGKGKDEATLTIGTSMYSTAFVLKQAGWLEGYSEDTLREMAQLLVAYNVRSCTVEEDFGQGMFVPLLRPFVKEEWKKANANRPKSDQGATEIVEARATKVQKELRILDVLEPIMDAHRLVVAHQVLLEDNHQVKRRDGTDLSDRYSLMYQMTRLTRERDCLTHDDRIEGLAGLCKQFQAMMGLNPREEYEEQQRRNLEEELKRFDEEFDDLQGVKKVGRRLRGNLRSGSRRRR